MYYPVLRAKQFELIALRTLANRLTPEVFCPVIEPVRLNISPLIKTIDILNQHHITPIVIINPTLGEFSSAEPLDFLNEIQLQASDIDFIPCVATKEFPVDELNDIIDELPDEFAVFVDDGLKKQHLSILEDAETILIKGKYRERLLKDLTHNIVHIEDGFQKKSRNSDYKKRSDFSYAHVDFIEDDDIHGFGDYTITGEAYTESGGPAYVVAIHLSYIDSEEDDSMYVEHFLSYDDGSPSGPGDKFGDALNQLIKCHQDSPDKFYPSSGLAGFLALEAENHFPGLGVVKKLSVQHHIETICHYLSEHS